MHHLHQLIPLLVLLVSLLLAPSPANLAPTGNDSAFSQTDPQASLSLGSSEGGQNEQSTRLTFDERTDFAQEETKSDGVNCAICLESLEEGSRGKAVAVACGHSFHADCIGMWTHSRQLCNSRVRCPMCRTEIATGRSNPFETNEGRIRGAIAAWQPAQFSTTPRPASSRRSRHCCCCCGCCREYYEHR